MPNYLDFNIDEFMNSINSRQAEFKQQLIRSSLLLMIFEEFRKYLIQQVDSFFSNCICFDKDEIKYKRGERFIEMIKAHGKGEKGQHKNKEFRASIYFIRELKFISISEANELERLYLLRHKTAHELFNIVINNSIEKIIQKKDIQFVFDIYQKVIRCWYEKIELPTDPDYTQNLHQEIDFNGIETIQTCTLKAMLKHFLT